MNFGSITILEESTKVVSSSRTLKPRARKGEMRQPAAALEMCVAHRVATNVSPTPSAEDHSAFMMGMARMMNAIGDDDIVDDTFFTIHKTVWDAIREWKKNNQALDNTHDNNR